MAGVRRVQHADAGIHCGLALGDQRLTDLTCLAEHDDGRALGIGPALRPLCRDYVHPGTVKTAEPRQPSDHGALVVDPNRSVSQVPRGVTTHNRQVEHRRARVIDDRPCRPRG